MGDRFQVASVAKGRSVASVVSSFGSGSMASCQGCLASVRFGGDVLKSSVRFELINLLDQVQREGGEICCNVRRPV